jgi:FtsP/CotA-like multicopper oxidase with cupredoxin domain
VKIQARLNGLEDPSKLPNPSKTYHEYVWHCHILEDEEHDMMRPLVVVVS